MSLRAVLFTSACAAAALVGAAPAQAVTATPIASCLTDTTQQPKLEGFRLPATTAVNNAGTPRGTVSVTLRTQTNELSGPVRITLIATDLFTGKQPPHFQYTTTDGGCKRYSFSLAADTGLKFQRFHPYWVTAQASYFNEGPPTGAPRLLSGLVFAY